MSQKIQHFYLPEIFLEIKWLGFRRSIPQLTRHWDLSLKNINFIFAKAINQYFREALARQYKIPFDSCLTSKDVQLTLHFLTPALMMKMNDQYRQKKKVTDVLSFGLLHSIAEFPAQDPATYLLGDIFICYDVMQKQARDFSISATDELFHLGVHGFLHLLGLDHERSRREEKFMFAEEKKILDLITQEKIRINSKT